MNRMISTTRQVEAATMIQTTWESLVSRLAQEDEGVELGRKGAEADKDKG